MLAVLGLGLVLGLAGCRGGDGGGVERLGVYDYVSDISLSETETAEETTAHREINIQKEFVDPDEPFGSADDLLNLVFEAKRLLYVEDKIDYPLPDYIFGIIDVDFDGFSEMFFHEKDMVQRGYNTCQVFSLKEETFLELLFEFKAYSRYSAPDSDTVYMIKEGDSDKKLIIYSYYTNSATKWETTLSEINKQDDVYTQNIINANYWDFNDIADGKQAPDFIFNGKNYISFEEYNNAVISYYLEEMSLVNFIYEPVTYTFEDYNFFSSNPTLDLIRQKMEDDYILLYGLYDEYLKNLLIN